MLASISTTDQRTFLHGWNACRGGPAKPVVYICRRTICREPGLHVILFPDVLAQPSVAFRRSAWLCFYATTALLSACSFIPSSGPTTSQIANAPATVAPTSTAVQIVAVDEAVARQLIAQRGASLFSETLGSPAASARNGTVGAGDTLEVSIWEAPPATLFGNIAPTAQPNGAMGTSR
ncbi:MAG: hypothetical protein ABI564_18700, partial [Ideonella sp.]